MSGLEIAGLVLGAFPVVIGALGQISEVAKRVGQFKNIQVEHSKCLMELEFQKIVFRHHLKDVLLPLFVEDAEIPGLLSDPAGPAWRKPQFDQLLRLRLWSCSELYMFYLEEMNSTLSKMGRELALDSDPILSRLKAGKSVDSTEVWPEKDNHDATKFHLYRLKFANGEATRASLLSDLNKYNTRLEQLLTLTDGEQQLQHDRNRSDVASHAILNAWRRADGVFRAIQGSWGCQCEQHDTNLLLQHQAEMEAGFHIIFARPTATAWELHTVSISEYGAPAKRQEQATVYDHREKPTTSDPSPLDSLGQPHITFRPRSQVTSTQKYRVTSQNPAFSASSTPEVPTMAVLGPQNEHILDLCSRVFASEAPYYGYVRGNDFQYIINPLEQSQVPGMYFLTQRQVFENKEMPQLPRSQRYALSLTLASSFLQLFDSLWLNTLEKDDVLFFINSTGLHFATDEPFLKKDSSPKTAERSGNANSIDRADSLAQLGIILLELCFGNTVSKTPHSLFWLREGRAKQMSGHDLLTAWSLLKEVTSEAGSDYTEAGRWCLDGNKTITHDDQWRQDMLQKVIQPLQRCQIT